jgi:hypothetical protein
MEISIGPYKCGIVNWGKQWRIASGPTHPRPVLVQPNLHEWASNAPTRCSSCPHPTLARSPATPPSPTTRISDSAGSSSTPSSSPSAYTPPDAPRPPLPVLPSPNPPLLPRPYHPAAALAHPHPPPPPKSSSLRPRLPSPPSSLPAPPLRSLPNAFLYLAGQCSLAQRSQSQISTAWPSG